MGDQELESMEDFDEISELDLERMKHQEFKREVVQACDDLEEILYFNKYHAKKIDRDDLEDVSRRLERTTKRFS